MRVVKKRISLSISEKKKAIEAVDVAKSFGTPSSTFSTILKYKEKVLGVHTRGDGDFPQLEDCLVTWLIKAV